MATDALANLFYTSSIKCSSPAPQYTMNTGNNNQFTGTGISDDSAGDMTADTAYTYTYDAENRIITASGMTGGPYCYTYDGNGLRVRKAHASGGSCTGTPTVDVLYWRNIAGNTIAETDGNGSTTNASYHEYIFFAGWRIAQSNPSAGSVNYYFADHLGSTRVVTNSSGSPCYEADFLPYGTEDTPAGFTNSCSTNYKFTGYERDAETAYGTSSGNDYAFARYYNARLGRFMSADPLGGDITDPQTLNLYTYVRNNPSKFIDPTGLIPCDEFDDPSCGGSGGCGFFGCLGPCDFGLCGYPGAPPPPNPPLPPSQVPPPDPNPSSGDPWVFGCETFGMPCGMDFPVGGSLSGCTYGSGSCGGIIFGLQDGDDQPIYSPDGFMIRVLVIERDTTPTISAPRKKQIPTTVRARVERPRSLQDFTFRYFPCYSVGTFVRLLGSPDRQVATGLAVFGVFSRAWLGIPAAAWIWDQSAEAAMACR
jgi:RHS repeat-associated protein